MNKIKLSLIGLIMLSLTGCGGDDSENKKQVTEPILQQTPIGEDVYEKAKDIFYALPSPVEMTTLIKSSGGEFRKDLILNPQRANDYQTLQKQAFALGVYGADLSYSGLYEQKQDAIKLLAAAKRLASKVGVEDAYNAEFIERANENLGNRDSIMGILTQVYWETNSSLKENNRNELAMLILGSGWVEGVYIGAELIDLNNIDQEIAKRLLEQKFTAMQLQELFKKYAENDIVSESYEVFAPLLDVFATLNVEVKSSTMKTDDASGKVIIGGKTELNYTTEDLKRLMKAAKDVRAKLIES
jgi:hypothetical protein